MTARARPLLAIGLAGLALAGTAGAASAPPERLVARVGLAKPLAAADTAVLRIFSRTQLTGVRVVTDGGPRKGVTLRLGAGKVRAVNVSAMLRHPSVRGLRILARGKGVVLSGSRRPRLLVTRAPVVVPPAPPPSGDTSAPSGVGSLVVSTTRTDVAISWSPASDNVGVTGYRVEIEGLAPVTSGSTSYTASGLECGRQYAVTVSARDAAGNAGAASSATATTAACPVIAAVGDIACSTSDASFLGGQGTATRCRQAHVANTVRAINPDVFLMLGDAQYDFASPSLLSGSYNPAFGDLLPRTKAVQGNHDFDAEVINTPGAQANGYFNYFGVAARPAGLTYYSFDLGTWHVVVLNSNCSTGAVNAPGCAAQLSWLQADLAATRQPCIAAAWHHPRWSSFPSAPGNPYGDNPALSPWVQALYDKGADLVLSGHAHHYERLGPVNPAEQSDAARGLMFWVVGTGGRDLRTATAPRASTATSQWTTFGPLKLTLGTRSYAWQFVRESGPAYSDTGSAACHSKT